jgi:nucleoside-diphosphate-sugar epimerase
MPGILITGRGSFIGASFRRYSKFRDVSEVSLRDVEPESVSFMGCDTVLHLAAIVHQSSGTSEQEYFRVNRDLALGIAERAKKAGVKHFIFLSTVKVYGKWIEGSKPWNESSECYPSDPYGKSKYEAEKGLRRLESDDFKVSVVRTPIVYGPGVGANILKLMRLAETFPLLPFSNIANNRHYTYVENLVGFIDRIIEKRASGVFILMDERPVSTTELVRLISEFMHRKIKLVHMPEILVKAGVKAMPSIFERLYRSFYLDNTLTKEILGFSPEYSIEEGISVMVESYLGDKKMV